jgi:tagatose 1,6-diphosphate aldolase
MTASSGDDGSRRGDRLPIGKRRALQVVSTPDNVFAILAIDHIAALAAVARPEDSESMADQDLVAMKVGLVESLGSGASGVLVDPILALGPVVESGVLPRDSGLLVALEDGDYASLDSAPRLFEGWDVGRAAATGANAVKCSFLYDPFSPSADAHAFVSHLVAGCERYGIPLFAEPLMPSVSSASRRDLVVETARTIGGLGVDVLKLQFPSSDTLPGAEAAWKDACTELTEASPRPWTLLSAGEGFDTFSRQLTIACEAGASGYVAGRAVWQDLVAVGDTAGGSELEEAQRRLGVLSEIATRHARPWTLWFEPVGAAPAQVA